MTTTLLNAEVALSKDIADYWAGTTTSAGAAGGTTVVDTALKAKANAWVPDECYDMITEGTYDGEERKISSLDNTSGTLTVLAHGGQIASGIDYRVHRLFTASDKRIALVRAAKNVWPDLFNEVLDDSLVSGNWLSDGSFERWTTTSNLTAWTETTVTVTQTSTAGLFKHGAYSAKLATAAGNISQSVTNWDDIKKLAGQRVTFKVQGHCDTASCLRLSFYDGVTTTYSSYHDGDSAWTKDSAPLEVNVTVDENPTEITFKVLHEVAAGTSYVDDARVIAGDVRRIYVGHLNLARNKPHQVLIEQSRYSNAEPYALLHNIEYSTDGYMYLPSSIPPDYRLRIKGTGYLDFLASGVASTAWTATIAVDEPQLQILVAEAALYLYQQIAMPNWESGRREEAQKMVSFWKMESAIRRARFGMNAPLGTVSWS